MSPYSGTSVPSLW